MRRRPYATAFGIMGGWNQAQAHAQFVSNVVDHGMNIQAALEAARVTKLTFDGCDVIMEPRGVRRPPGRGSQARATSSTCRAISPAWSVVASA